jgi:hypothetical protein
MTKKAQFIIPNVFIKEANKGRLLMAGIRGGRRAISSATKGVNPVGVRRPISSQIIAGKKPVVIQGTGVGASNPNSSAIEELAHRSTPKGYELGKILTSTPRTAAQASRRLAAERATQMSAKKIKGEAIRSGLKEKRIVSGSSPAPASASAPSKEVDTFTDLPGDMVYKPGLINRALSSTAGRVALPVATGAVGYGFGNSSGYDEGFGQGSLSAQQMAAIQAMQAQQQARQMYDNQGFLDRLMGRNPF